MRAAVLTKTTTARTCALGALVIAFAVGSIFACSDDASSRLFPGALADGGPKPDSGLESPFGDGGSAIGSVSGIVIVHAAAFQSFRLCFENYLDIAPQPDDTVMPEANVVGVEVGSAVRIGALEQAPGKVYIIDRRELRQPPNEAPKSCKNVMKGLSLDRHYHESGPLTEPLGVGHVDVLALTGCGDESRLAELGIPPAECGANWDRVKGSLVVRTLPLFPSIAATTSMLPVQLVHMSSMLEAQRGANTIDVTYGLIDGGTAALAQTVASKPELFDASTPKTLGVDQAGDASVYGEQGFRIALRPPAVGGGDAGAGGGPASFSIDQSLADVQDLSSPTTVPTTYYLAASNYVLLLLGDPRVPRRYSDGGVNPNFDPRRAVHLLAVPVKDPASEDAGTPEPIDSGPPTSNDP